jgi:hypothetical protein
LLRRHLLAIAKTRRGKSSLMLRLVHHLMLAGTTEPGGREAGADKRCLILVDPHSDLATAALALVPPERRADVVYLDIANRKRPFGINLLDVGLGWDRDQAVGNALRVFKREFDAFWGPRMEDAWRGVVGAPGQGCTSAGATSVSRALLGWERVDNVVKVGHVPRLTTGSPLESFRQDGIREAPPVWRAPVREQLLHLIGRHPFITVDQLADLLTTTAIAANSGPHARRQRRVRGIRDRRRHIERHRSACQLKLERRWIFVRCLNSRCMKEMR